MRTPPPPRPPQISVPRFYTLLITGLLSEKSQIINNNGIRVEVLLKNQLKQFTTMKTVIF